MDIIDDLEIIEMMEKGQAFNEELSHVFKKYINKFEDMELFFKMLCHGIPVFMSQVSDFIIEDVSFNQKLELIEQFSHHAKTILLVTGNHFYDKKLDS